MSKRNPTKKELRALALQALWKALGREPSEVREPVHFPDGVRCYLDVAEWLPESPEAQEVMEVDLHDLALETHDIWSVSHDDRGAEYVEALDLGDEFLYEAYTLTEVEHGTLRRAIPKRLAEKELDAMRSGLGDAQLLTPDWDWQPTSVGVRGLESPEDLRIAVHALSREGFARHVIETMYKCPWREEESTEDDEDDDGSVASNTARLRKLWKAAVRCDPPRRGLPPGFATLVGRSREFAAWLEHTAVSWKDTGRRLDAEEAEALRMTCLFLAATRA